ncbi:Insect oxytocin/vasopressin-like peptide [Frankliniella occidentalis]|nr:Insect oxytocin/vasopressin-like peptide [Frankliniella occidentalis]
MRIMSRGGAGSGLLLGAALLALLGVGWACLITNCPRGGKRAGGAAAGRSREVQCTPCGPGGEGLCVGPGICCSPVFGCVLTSRGGCGRGAVFAPRCSPSSAALAAASAAAVPLDAPCGADLTPDGSAPGRCAAQGVCCTHDSCRIDAVCQSRDDNDLNAPGFDADLMLTSLRRVVGGGTTT